MLVDITYVTSVRSQVGNLIDIISSRPKNRDGYWRHLLGSNLHVVLAMVPGMEDSDGEAVCFSPRSLRRIIDELCHEVGGECGVWAFLRAACWRWCWCWCWCGALFSLWGSAALVLVVLFLVAH